MRRKASRSQPERLSGVGRIECRTHGRYVVVGGNLKRLGSQRVPTTSAGRSVIKRNQADLEASAGQAAFTRTLL